MEREETKEQIEAYLLDQGGWVPSREICGMFGVTERQLRQTGDMPGLCSDFAISGNDGFKHVSKASTTEWNHFSRRLRQHGIMELVRVRTLRSVRKDVTRIFKARRFEKDTGQAVMAI